MGTSGIYSTETEKKGNTSSQGTAVFHFLLSTSQMAHNFLGNGNLSEISFALKVKSLLKKSEVFFCNLTGNVYRG